MSDNILCVPFDVFTIAQHTDEHSTLLDRLPHKYETGVRAAAIGRCTEDGRWRGGSIAHAQTPTSGFGFLKTCSFSTVWRAGLSTQLGVQISL